MQQLCEQQPMDSRLCEPSYASCSLKLDLVCRKAFKKKPKKKWWPVATTGFPSRILKKIYRGRSFIDNKKGKQRSSAAFGAIELGLGVQEALLQGRALSSDSAAMASAEKRPTRVAEFGLHDSREFQELIRNSPSQVFQPLFANS